MRNFLWTGASGREEREGVVSEAFSALQELSEAVEKETLRLWTLSVTASFLEDPLPAVGLKV